MAKCPQLLKRLNTERILQNLIKFGNDIRQRVLDLSSLLVYIGRWIANRLYGHRAQALIIPLFIQ